MNEFEPESPSVVGSVNPGATLTRWVASQNRYRRLCPLWCEAPFGGRVRVVPEMNGLAGHSPLSTSLIVIGGRLPHHTVRM